MESNNGKKIWLFLLIIPLIVILIFASVSYFSYKSWDYCNVNTLKSTLISKNDNNFPLIAAEYYLDNSQDKKIKKCILKYGANIYVKSASYQGDNTKLSYWINNNGSLAQEEILLPFEKVEIDLSRSDEVLYGVKSLSYEYDFEKPSFSSYLKKIVSGTDYEIKRSENKVILADTQPLYQQMSSYVDLLYSLYVSDNNILKYSDAQLIGDSSLNFFSYKTNNAKLVSYTESDNPYDLFTSSLFLFKYINSENVYDSKDKALEIVNGIPSVFTIDEYSSNDSHDRRYECILAQRNYEESVKCGEKCNSISGYFGSIVAQCESKKNPTCEYNNLVDNPIETIANLSRAWSEGESYWGRKATDDLFIKLFEYSDTKIYAVENGKSDTQYSQNDLCRVLSITNDFGSPIALNKCIMQIIMSEYITTDAGSNIDVLSCGLEISDYNVSDMLWYYFTYDLYINNIKANSQVSIEDEEIESFSRWLISPDRSFIYTADVDMVDIDLTSSSLFYILQFGQ